MESPQPFSIRSIGFKYGIIAAVIFIIVFLVARAMGINNFAFHFINYVFLAIVIGLAFNEVKKITHMHRLNYLPGLGLGATVTVVTGVLFAIFLLVYSNMINKSFVPDIRPYLPFQDYVNAGMIAFVAFGETLIFGFISSFVLMQLFKRNRGAGTEAIEEDAERHPEGNREPNAR